MGEERRKYKRVKIEGEVRVSYRTGESAGRISETVNIQDLSLGGARITSEVPYPLSMAIALDIPLPGGTVEADGTIIRIVEAADGDTYDLGIQFTHVSDDSLRKLQEFIR